jgi:ribose transport system permease protein
MRPGQADDPLTHAPALLRRLLTVPEIGVLVPLLLLCGTFFAIDPHFLAPDSISVMLRALAFVGIIAIAQTWLMIAGEIDLSVGSVAGLGAIVATLVMQQTGLTSVGIVAGLLTGALAGLINGLVVVRFGLPGFIATLGMLYIARGANYLLCKGYPVHPLPESFTAFGAAEPLGISWAFIIFALLALLSDLALRRTVYGRRVLATGGNAEVARIAGIRTGAVRAYCYVASGLAAALAGILLSAQLGVGQPENGTGWELDVIASVVIGGVSLFGGLGTVAGTILGLLVMQVVRSGLVVAGVNTHWQTVAVGVIMIAAVGLDLLRRRAKA